MANSNKHNNPKDDAIAKRSPPKPTLAFVIRLMHFGRYLTNDKFLLLVYIQQVFCI